MKIVPVYNKFVFTGDVKVGAREPHSVLRRLSYHRGNILVSEDKHQEYNTNKKSDFCSYSKKFYC